MTPQVDPLAGSYYVEALTDRIETGARALIEEVDALGGAAAAVERGYFQEAIARERMGAAAGAGGGGDQVVVGVNRFTDDSRRRRSSSCPTSARWRGEQRERLAGVRQARDGDAVASDARRRVRRTGRGRRADDAADPGRGAGPGHAGRDQRRAAGGLGDLPRTVTSA